MKFMKRFIAMLIALVVMLSVAVPAVVSAATKINVTQSEDSTNSVKVKWDTILGAKRYKIEISESADSGYIVSDDYATGYERTIYSLGAGKTYYVKVTAYINDGFDASTTSEPLAVVTAPEKAENFRQTAATTSSATFKWDAAKGATSYKIYARANNQEYPIGTTEKTTYTVKKLKNNAKIENDYFVRAIRTDGGYNAGLTTSYYNCSQIYSYNINLVPKKAPKPKVSSAYSNIGVVYFTSPSLPFQKGYETAVYKADGKKVFKKGTGYRFEGLDQNQFYKVKTRAYTNIGANKSNSYGAWSDYCYFSLGCKKVNVKAAKTSLSVYWSKVKGGKVTYDIYISKTYDAGLKKVKANVKGTSLKITKFGKKSLKKGTTYYVYVKPKLKVGKKTYVSPVYSYTSATTLK